VERAEYEANLAKRRFMQVDPDNRLVADTLEAEWNEKLRQLQDANDYYARHRQPESAKLKKVQEKEVIKLAKAIVSMGKSLQGLRTATSLKPDIQDCEHWAS